MDLERDVLGWNVVLTPRNVEEIYRSYHILKELGEHGKCGVLRRLNVAGDEFLTISIDLDGEKPVEKKHISKVDDEDDFKPITSTRLAEIMSQHPEFSEYTIGDDNDGQLIVYTNLKLSIEEKDNDVTP